MRFLLDSNLSHRVAAMLRAGGLDCEHVRDHELQAESDEVILAFARDRGLTVVSEDTDFGELLARQRSAAPSFVLLRTNGPMPPEEHAALLLSVIPRVRDEPVAGAVVVIGRDRSESVSCRCFLRCPSSVINDW